MTKVEAAFEPFDEDKKYGLLMRIARSQPRAREAECSAWEGATMMSRKTMADLIEYLYYDGRYPAGPVAAIARELALEAEPRVKGIGVGNILVFRDGSYTHTRGAAKFTAGYYEETK